MLISHLIRLYSLSFNPNTHTHIYTQTHPHTPTHTPTHTPEQSWALSVVLNFFNNKKSFFCIFYQVNSLFLNRVLFKKPTPSLINLVRNAKINFALLKKWKNTESAQLCTWVVGGEGVVEGGDKGAWRLAQVDRGEGGRGRRRLLLLTGAILLLIIILIIIVVFLLFCQERSNVCFNINPLVPRVQNIKICHLTLNRHLLVGFVEKMVYLGDHYSERHGLMG